MKLILELISYIYGFLAVLRRYLYETGILKKKKLPLPVISIGNLSVGGTGKTPLTIYTAKKLKEKGFKPCILSRGYKRKSKGILIVSDGKNIKVSWEESGDEPFIMARRGLPVIVGSDRYQAGLEALQKLDVNVFILDDGYQHYQLFRDVNILITDASKPFWEDKLLPVGRLREPVSFYKYADFIVVTKLSMVSEKEIEKIKNKLNELGKPFFFAKDKITGLLDVKGNKFDFSILEKKEIIVFSGLGNNKQFFETVKKLSKKYNFKIEDFIEFPDHYDYKDFNLPKADLYLTTEKDIIKINNENVFALIYDVDVEERFIEKIVEKIKKEENSSLN
jgi:tetraacyldisaccharide 4'-kinase